MSKVTIYAFIITMLGIGWIYAVLNVVS